MNDIEDKIIKDVKNNQNARTNTKRSKKIVSQAHAYGRTYSESNYGQNVWLQPFGECAYRKKEK